MRNFIVFISILSTFSFFNAEAQIPEGIYDEYLDTIQLLGSQNYDEFITRNKNLISRYSQFCKLYEKQASAYYYSDQLEKGEEYFFQLIKLDSSTSLPYYGLGLIYHYQKRYTHAVGYFKRALDYSNHCNEIYISIVNSFNKAGRLKEAQEYLETFLHKDDTDIYAYLALGYLYQLKNQWEKSDSYLTESVEINPDYWRGYFLLSRLELVLRGNYKDALDYLEKAKTLINQSINDPEVDAKIKARMATIVSSLGKLNEANDYFNQAIAVFKRFGTKSELAASLNNLGTNLVSQGKYKKAIMIFEQAIPEYKAVNYNKGVGYALGNIGNAYSKMGYYQKGIEFYKKTLEIARESEDLNFERLVLSDIGEIYWSLGNYSQALEIYYDARKVNENLGNKWVDAVILQSLAGIYKDLGNLQKSLEYYDVSIEKFREIGDSQRLALNLSLLGTVHWKRGNLERALHLLQESYQASIKIGDPEIRINSLLQIGQISLEKGDSSKALKNISEALAFSQTSHNNPKIARALIKLGEYYFTLENFEDALEYYSKGLHIVEEIHLPHIEWQAHAGIASTLEKKKQPTKALHHYEAAIEILNSIESTTTEVPFFTDFLKDKISVYTSLIQLLVKMQRFEEAFQLAEKLKVSKSTSENLNTNVNVVTEISEDLKISLLDLKSKLEQKHRELSEELAKPDTLRVAKKIEVLESQISKLLSEKINLWRELEHKHQDFYNLVNYQPLNIQQIQNDILQQKQCIIEYVVGDYKTSVFLITQDAFYYHEIGISKDSLYKAIRTTSPKFQSGISQDENDFYFNARQMDFRVSTLSYLYEIIFKPIEPYLENVQELVIIPDDILTYIPFEMLVTDTSETLNEYDFRQTTFLLHKFAISYGYSIESLMKRGRNKNQPRSQLIAFGNPKFNKTKNKLFEYLKYNPTPSAFVQSNRFKPLPYAEQEVKQIAKILNEDEKNIFTGGEATEGNLKKYVKDYQIIHIATHHLLNDWEPLYSKMVMAQNAGSHEDGFLETYEILNLELNADLVVLSACNTGIGKLKRGEGLIGLARAFLYAGSRSLIASLWNVNDASASIIQQKLYTNLKKGMKKNLALQQAKIEYLSSVEYNKDPFYWAPFILIGDVSSIDFMNVSGSTAEFTRRNVAILLIILVVFILLTLIYLRHKSLKTSTK